MSKEINCTNSVQFCGHLVRQYRVCVVDSLGWELRLIPLYCMCVQGIPILSVLIFVPSLYSHSEFLHLLVSSHF